MNGIVKIGIVAALTLTVIAVIKLKQSPAPPAAQATTQPSQVAALPATQPVSAALPRLVDLGANKCIPCKRMAPILEELKTSLTGKLEVEFIDVWQNPQIGESYAINLIPTQIFYDASGKELSRHEGFMPREDILARFKEHGIDLPAGPGTSQ